MTERDLENMKSMAVPQARADAKRAALDAAMAAFENGLKKTSSLPAGAALGVSEATMQNMSEATVQSASGATNKEPSQGNIIPRRQTETSTAKRSFRMNFSSRSTQAMAASVAALVVAAPFAFQHLQTLRDAHPPVTVAAVKTSPVTPQTEADVRKDDKVISERRSRDAGGEKKKAETVTPQAATVAAPEPAPAAAPPAPPTGAGNQQQGAIGPVAAPLKTDRKDLALNGADPAAGRFASPTDGLGAVGNEMTRGLGGGTPAPAPPGVADARQQSAVAGLIAPATPSATPREAMTGNLYEGPARSADSNAHRGRRFLKGPEALAPADPAKPNPYAWMGRDKDQPASVAEENRDKFDATDINAIKQVATEPVSTFSVDVDTASYAFVRRALTAGRLPPKDAVRIEEMINYFPYAYPAPDTAETPFKPTVTVMPSPWNKHNKLVHVAIKGYDLKNNERPRVNLVLLMDVSGSMATADRLPLVKNAFRMLVDQLKPDDTVAIVTYASGSGIALEPTKISEKAKILSAIDRLGAGGSTAGAAGITDAYRLAEAGFDKNAVNRVILATDGDFNVGISDKSELKSFIERKRQSGIFLSILGVGQGNNNDALMQTLAQNGNGTAAYVDTLSEARKVLVDEASSTLFTIAKDVKAQIEWNPERVAEYRLIGYETRALKREDFNNDHVDAGDIGSGHTVTAIYEITPVGAQPAADALRYGRKTAAVAAVPNEPADAKAVATSNELGFLKLRYKRPNEDTSQLITLPLSDALAKTDMSDVPAEQRFSIAVAAFAQMLKGESYIHSFTADDVLALAQSARGDDPFGYRAEFLNLVRLAKSAQP